MCTADRALALAAMGYHVFPLQSGGKEPIAGMSFKQLATRDPGTIRNWWQHNSYNIGIYAGRYGNDGALLVADVDIKNGRPGFATLAKLELEIDLPPTAEQITASGGRHIIYRVAEAVGQGGANVLGPGIDARSRGGYIVGPGSVINGVEYRWRNGVCTPAPAPAALLSRLPKETPQPATPPPAEALTSSANLWLAIDYASETAEPAVANDGGNSQTYRVAAAIRDFGVSYLDAANVLLRYYNPRCEPPWAPGDLFKIVRNAYGYATGAAGSKSPATDFSLVDPTDPHGLMPAPEPTWSAQAWVLPPLDEIPPRPWVLGRLLLRGKLSVLIAPPGVGKSTFSLCAAVAVATGIERVINEPVVDQGPVLMIANEDDRDELDRRLAALILHHDISPEVLAGRLRLATASDPIAFTLARASKEGDVYPVHRDALAAEIKAHGIKLLIVDPFLETHGVNENDNRQINDVARMYRALAVECDIAILIIHHTRKPPAGASDAHIGSMDSARGASSLAGAARVVKTLYGMTKKDAAARGLDDNQRARYLRLDGAKANLELLTDSAKWYYKQSVALPGGEVVGALEPTTVPAETGARKED